MNGLMRAEMKGVCQVVSDGDFTRYSGACIDVHE